MYITYNDILHLMTPVRNISALVSRRTKDFTYKDSMTNIVLICCFPGFIITVHGRCSF